MTQVTVKLADDIRVDLKCRAHTFPAQLAIALVEVMQYAVYEEESFDLWEGETERGDTVYWCEVGNECVSGRTAQEAVIDFWQNYVSYKRSRR